MKRFIYTILVCLMIQINVFGYSLPINFLPMEDALSSARNNTSLVDRNQKPFREPFSLGDKKTKKEQLLSFSNIDIFAFVLLAGVYVMLVRRKSKPRNISF